MNWCTLLRITWGSFGLGMLFGDAITWTSSQRLWIFQLVTLFNGVRLFLIALRREIKLENFSHRFHTLYSTHGLFIASRYWRWKYAAFESGLILEQHLCANYLLCCFYSKFIANFVKKTFVYSVCKNCIWKMSQIIWTFHILSGANWQ